MTIRPIIFSTPMVQALLAGWKTQTRRLASSPLRRVKPGDLLYVRESFALTQHSTPVYRADARDADGTRWSSITPGDPEREVKWTPSIHMPRWASRLTLEVTEVRLQQLKGISWEDAEAEGVWHSSAEYREQVCVWRDTPSRLRTLRIDHFSKLWDSLHDKPGERWEDNPEVIALSFSVHRCNVDAFMERVS